MNESKKRLNSAEVLRYQIEKKINRNTIRRHYLKWRQNHTPPLPERCDNPECFFFTNPLIWNKKPFKPILDHINGNNSDNRPKNLRLLCPNCDSQLETRGGKNKGRVEKSKGGFAIVEKDGRKNYELPIEPIKIPFMDKDGNSKTFIITGKDDC